MRHLLCVGLVGIAIGGCTSDFECKLGELTGTWRLHYVQTDGNCGEIPDETAILDPGAQPDPSCNGTRLVSDDQCRIDSDLTCPTTDGRGTTHWTIVIRHVEAGRIEGTGTLEVSHEDLGSCRSTYDMTMVEL